MKRLLLQQLSAWPAEGDALDLEEDRSEVGHHICELLYFLEGSDCVFKQQFRTPTCVRLPKLTFRRKSGVYVAS